MPWCGYAGTGGALWWVLPLIGLVIMGVMVFACLRGFGRCMGARRRTPGELSQLQHEIERLKEDVHELARHRE